MTKEETLQEKQRLFKLYEVNFVMEGFNHLSGQRASISKEYLRNFGTVLKEDIKTQYEPSEAPVISTEVATIAQVVKVVQISPKEVIKKLDKVVEEEKTEVKPVVKKAKKKESSPRVTGEFISRLNGIFKYLEAADRRGVETLNELRKDTEIKAKNTEIKDRDSALVAKKQNEQIEFLRKECKIKDELLIKSKTDTEIAKEQLTKSMIETEIAKEQLLQLQQQRAK